MKRTGLIALLLALSMALGLAACGGGGDVTPSGGQVPDEGQAPADGETPDEGQAPDDGQPSDTEDSFAGTAMEVMRAVNGGLVPGPAEDKYRSFYEVFVYSFYDSDGDGIGDLRGVLEKLDYINDGDPATDSDLGATGIWLMPVNPSPTYHKYDVTDYRAIDPQYGTLEDLQALLTECHSRGINVILDLVMNHTSSQHPWFTQAVDYLASLPEGVEPDAAACPYVDYYNFTREKGAGMYEAGSTGWYYDAPFWSEMPDLNLSSEAVRAELADIADYWLDMGVDGFRLDAAKEFFSGEPEKNIEFLTWFNGAVKAEHPDAYIVAEVWNDLATYAQYYKSGIDSVFNFSFADSSGTIASVVKGTAPASAYGESVVRAQAEFDKYSGSWIDAPFFVNHDMGRAAGYFPGDAGIYHVKLAQAMNLMMSGASFTYYGEELGMKGSGKDENKRAPMYWSDDPAAPGMCSGPEGMDKVSMKFPDANTQLADGDSILNFTIQALRLRAAVPEISHGRAEVVESLSSDTICALRKTYDGSSVTLIFNLSSDDAALDVSGLDGREIVGALVTSCRAPAVEGGTLTVPGYSVCVVR